MAKGTFDQVRMINNDLSNMLAIVSGDPEITKEAQEQESSTGHEAETASPCDGVEKVPKDVARSLQESHTLGKSLQHTRWQSKKHKTSSGQL